MGRGVSSEGFGRLSYEGTKGFYPVSEVLSTLVGDAVLEALLVSPKPDQGGPARKLTAPERKPPPKLLPDLGS